MRWGSSGDDGGSSGDNGGSGTGRRWRERREAIIRKFKRRGERKKHNNHPKKLTIRKVWMRGQ